MTTKKQNKYMKRLIGGLLTVFLVFGAVTVGQTVVAQGNAGLTGNFLTGNFHIPEGTILSILRGLFPEGENFTPGAIVGPDSYNTYTGENDVRRYPRRQIMSQGTTTVCSFIAPVAASSTPLFASANFTLGSTSAITVAFYKSLGDPTATTTLISEIVAITADQGGTVIASTTNGIGALNTPADFIFSTGEVLVVSTTGGDSESHTSSAPGFVPEGNCNVIWQEL